MLGYSPASFPSVIMLWASCIRVDLNCCLLPQYRVQVGDLDGSSFEKYGSWFQSLPGRIWTMNLDGYIQVAECWWVSEICSCLIVDWYKKCTHVTGWSLRVYCLKCYNHTCCIYTEINTVHITRGLGYCGPLLWVLCFFGLLKYVQ